MWDHVRTDSTTSNPNTLPHQKLPKRPIIQSGRNMLEESVPTFENVEFVFAKEISRFLHKLDRVVTDKSSLHRRRIQGKCVP